MDGDKQVGHALYVRKKYNPYGTMTWVLQLVVDVHYRRKGIASTLLRSIWGFSDDFAWGLVSANPCTVRTLESATFRNCDPKLIEKNLTALKMIGRDTSFVKDDAYEVGHCISQVNTEFYVDNKDFFGEYDCSDRLGNLKPGREWLAFTFREQPIDKKSFRNHFKNMILEYENILIDAYGRMKMKSHPWTKGTDEEVDFIKNYCPSGRILDLGCGFGRHSIGLAKAGYSVVGVDNSADHLIQAIQSEKDENRVRFIEDDVRFFIDQNNHFDMVICLYDVVGSYPYKEDNIRIIKTAHRNLRQGGTFILSVMNMELTESIIPKEQKGVLRFHPELLEKLVPSNTMQESGQIFNPAYLLLDTSRNKLVYRKEQFENDNGLPAEYIIRDKRFTGKEISKYVKEAGFIIEELRYVQSGKFSIKLEPTDKNAKEILLVCRKRIH